MVYFTSFLESQSSSEALPRGDDSLPEPGGRIINKLSSVTERSYCSEEGEEDEEEEQRLGLVDRYAGFQVQLC